MASQTKSRKGIVAVGIFLFFGAIMAALAGTTLVWRGTTLDRLLLLNQGAYQELAPHGKAVGIPFLLLSIGLAVAGTGWFKRRFWGWRLAVGIIAVQILGDVVNVFLGDLVRGGIGIIIAGSLHISAASRGQRCFCKCRCMMRSLKTRGSWKLVPS